MYVELHSSLSAPAVLPASEDTLLASYLHLKVTVQSADHRVQWWGIPPHWSRADWVREIHQVEDDAAWLAVKTFNPSVGVTLSAYCYGRVLASVLAFARRRRDPRILQ